MSVDPGAVAALAAALVPERAPALLARHPGTNPDALGTLLASPRESRLAALASALAVPGDRDPPPAPGSSGGRTRVCPPDVREANGSSDPAPERRAWPVLGTGEVLPFDLPTSAPALALLDGPLLDLGALAARSAAHGIASVLGGEATVTGRLLAGVLEPAGAVLVPVELTAISGVALLAIDRAFAARLAGQVAGASAHSGEPGALSPAERSVVELAVLGALDAIAAESGIEAALAPRLALRGGAPVRPLCVELTVSAAGARGRALLVLPEACLRALRREAALPPALAGVPVAATVRIGEAALDPRHVAALRPGDVLVLDGPADAASLHLPGGLAARGRLEGTSLEVTEVDEPGAGNAPGSAPVALLVELARVSLPLGEIARIAPGAVLPLGLDRSGRVTLRIGERAVAWGELVEVDGAVGVRIRGAGEAP